MHPSDVHEKLLDLIYSAPGDPARWMELMVALAAQFRAEGAHIIQLNPNTRYQLAASTGVPEDGLRSYESYYGALDPWGIVGRQKFQEGVVWWGEDWVPHQAMLQTEFYNDFGKKFAIFHEVGACLLKDGPNVAAITFHRSQKFTAFDEPDMRLLGLIVPHLQRALRLHSKMIDLQTANDTLSGAFDSVPIGIVLLGKNGILNVNKAATEICRNSKSLYLTQEGIRASVSRVDERLRKIIRSAMDPAQDNNGGGSVCIASESGNPVVVVASPVPSGDWPCETGVVVFLTDRNHSSDASAEILRTAFGLTPAEVRLASMLAKGLSPTEVADELTVSLNTIRTQLKAIFAKTNTSRQSQLATLLARLPRDI